MNLRDFVPPVLLRLRNLRKRRTYKSFDDALRASGKGYGDERLAEVVFEKTRRYRDLLQQRPRAVDLPSLRSLIAVQLSLSQSRLNVIDFGGACGAHYFLVKSLLGDRADLNWHIVETPAMVERGRTFAADNLWFHTSLSAAKNVLPRVDLLYSSGALHYLSDPLGTLQQMINLGAANIFFTRLGLSSSAEEVIVVQETRLGDNGPGALPEGFVDTAVSYPATFVPRKKFEEILAPGYTIEMIVDEGTHSLRSHRHSLGTFGYFATRKS